MKKNFNTEAAGAAARLPGRIKECLAAAAELETAARDGERDRVGGPLPAFTALIAGLTALSLDLGEARMSEAAGGVRESLASLAGTGARCVRGARPEVVMLEIERASSCEVPGLRDLLEGLLAGFPGEAEAGSFSRNRAAQTASA